MKGHVRERGAGNWYAVIDLHDPVTGKRKRKWHSLEAKGKREAQIECARLISELSSGTYMEPSKTTMAQYLDRWLDHIKAQVSPRSHERYAEIARKNLAPLIGGVVLSKLQPAQISAAYGKALINGRRDGAGGLSPRTVHHMHRVLKQALEQAVKWRVLPAILPMLLTRPRSSGGKCTTYDMAQTAALVGWLPRQPHVHSDPASCPLRASSRRNSGPAVARTSTLAPAACRGRERRAD